MAYFEAKGIKKRFGGVKALSNGEITLHKGKILGLLGANGSGKSTLSKLIAGIYTPCSGDFFLEGSEIQISNPDEAKKRGIVMVHQHLSLIPELTVWQNIILGRESTKALKLLNDGDNITRAKEILFRLSDTIDLEEQVKNLSSSEKQIVEIAKGLSQDAKILILDEPTAALEQHQVERLFKILKELKEQGVCMIFISHRMWEVTKICDHISVFRNGHTVGHIDFKTEGIAEDKIISFIVGKEVIQKEKEVRQRKQSNEGIMLTTRSLKLGKCVQDVNLQINKGEIVGIAGLQGQGQEELLLILSGLMKKDSGEIYIEDKKINLKSPKEAICNGMVLVPGDRHEEGVFLEHSMFYNLIYTQFVLKLTKVFLNYKKLKVQAKQIIRTMNIQPEDEEMIVKNLSGGNQQKIVVGKWLPLMPKVLLLSDPAKGVDINAKEEMYQVIKGLAEGGTSVLIYASDNEELLGLCDRILVMFEGEVIDDLDAEGLTDETLVEASLGVKKEQIENEVSVHV